MTRDPIRYLQDSGADPAMAELLRGAAAPFGLPVAVQARVGATLQNLVSGAASASVATSGSVSAGAKTGWFTAAAAKSAALVGVAAVAVIAGGLMLTVRGGARAGQRASAEHRPGVLVDSQDSHSFPLATSAVESPAPTVSDLPLEVDASPTAVRVGAKQLTHGPAAAARTTRSNLAEEARLLEAVRMRMAVEPAAARRALAEYDAKFRHGVLKEERDLLAVKLAVVEGRHGEAKQQAIQMEQQAKDSPYSKKAREVTKAIEREPGARTSKE